MAKNWLVEDEHDNNKKKKTRNLKYVSSNFDDIGVITVDKIKNERVSCRGT